MSIKVISDVGIDLDTYILECKYENEYYSNLLRPYPLLFLMDHCLPYKVGLGWLYEANASNNNGTLCQVTPKIILH